MKISTKGRYGLRIMTDLAVNGNEGCVSLKDIAERDHRDMTREIAPLKQADDAILIDSSDMTIDEVIDLLDELGIAFNTLAIDKKGVRVLKDVGDKEVPIFWVDEFEKLEEILIDIKNSVLVHPAQPK